MSSTCLTCSGVRFRAAGFFGAQLARAGEDVNFIARGEHLRAIRANGLRTIGAHVYPSVTNFVLTRWPDPATAQAVYDWLEQRGMVVRNFAHHAVIPGHLRITVRSAEENARLLGALAAWRAALVGVAG